MSRQDKATTDRNARILRELVKQPDNKQCADCRRNDARWASWNLGVFICIRCSGIHRSMGTHISRVKSIDLDIWTPEQMAGMQDWGNRLANIYWEQHLKPGHVPPEHKIESFIRSKYESKRWAMDGPRPDPRTLNGGAPAAPVSESVAHQPPQQVRSPPPPTMTTTAAASTSRALPRAAHPLLSTTVSSKPAAAPSLISTSSSAAPAPATAPAPAPSSSIFDLDFHQPAPSATPQAQQQQVTSKKNDIMSLFGAPPPPAPAPQPWGSYTSTPAAAPSAAASGGMGGLMNGFGGMDLGGGASTNVWGDPEPAAAPPQRAMYQQQQQQRQPPAPTPNLWDATPSQNVWASPAPTAAAPAPQQDAFADIWK